MSFSDLMSSGRGPGVIGMVMALVVLLGFGLLFTFATDDSLQGADQSIESIIRRQQTEIGSLKVSVAEGEAKLATVPGLLAASKSLEQNRRQSETSATEIEALKKAVADSTSAVADVRKSFEEYKDEYRNLVRSRAKDENIARLVTASGVVYTNVNIREVTPVGIQIRHDEGQKRIAFEELPEEMQERFQFDPNQKVAALARENDARAAHESDVAATHAQIDAELARQKAENAILAKKQAKEALVAKQAQLREKEQEVKSFENAIKAERNKPLSRAPAMEGQLVRKREELAALRSQVAQLKAMP